MSQPEEVDVNEILFRSTHRELQLVPIPTSSADEQPRKAQRNERQIQGKVFFETAEQEAARCLFARGSAPLILLPELTTAPHDHLSISRIKALSAAGSMVLVS
jgi:hypothetical protein